MTQAELARAIGRDNTAISKIESGSRGVNSYELALIAEALDTSPDELLGLAAPASAMQVAGRIAQVQHPEDVHTALARVRRIFEVEALLDRIAPEPRHKPDLGQAMIPRSGTAVQQGRTLAADVRDALGLGDAPVPDISQLIEHRFGIDVSLELLPETVDGLCIQISGATLLIANSKHYLGRQRFTLAHESCHFLCRDGEEIVVEQLLQGAHSRREIRANAFAANFLMPAPVINSIIRGRAIDERVLTELMYVLGVSLMSLSYQLQNLRLVSTSKADYIRTLQPSHLFLAAGYRAEWAAAEGRRNIVRPPSRLQQRAITAYKIGRIGIGPLADLFDAPDPESLRAELAEQGISYAPFDMAPTSLRS
jgi:Zn-dependent peptidase ImmA (M78 family)/transcriptional regulator with XRE-family HTH domain